MKERQWARSKPGRTKLKIYKNPYWKQNVTSKLKEKKNLKSQTVISFRSPGTVSVVGPFKQLKDNT